MSVVRLRSARAVAWSPYTIPRSLHGDWWSSSDYGTALMTDDGGGLISSWKGRINGLDMTAATTARPTYSATGFNAAYPAVVGNGTANVMNRESTAGLPTGTTPGFMAVVGGGFTASDTIVAYGGGGSSATRQIDTSSANILRARATNVIISSEDSGGAPSVVLFICEAGRLRIRVNGAETIRTNTLGSITAVRTRFFASTAASPAGFAAGPLSEVLIGYAWPDADYLRLEGWMAGQYGLTLADGHPYQSSSP